MSPQAQVYYDSRQTTLEQDGRIYTRGDIITASMPSGGGRTNRKVEFVAYVKPDGKVPYVEVKEGGVKGDGGLTRCILPEHIKKGGRKI